jgi:uroporphyrinogen-III decarboxylase
MKSACFACKETKVLTEEHIIPQALGGRLKAKLYCKTCNENFGKDITFWGGGVDVQKTLPFGTREDVITQVIERIDIFKPGGGFVFNPIHNVQQGVPPENITAAYDTALKFGKYK